MAPRTKFPEYAATLQEPVICVKPRRLPVLIACTVLLVIVGVLAMGTVIWADVTFFNLNRTPLIPRILLVAVVAGCTYGIYTSVQEARVSLKLSFYKDRLILSYDHRPMLWKQEDLPRTMEVLYKDITGCIFSYRRLKVTLTTRGYLLTVGDAEPVRKLGTIVFSTQGAPPHA